MIKLDVQPYCDKCCDFDSVITKPTRIFLPDGGVDQTDTIVRCKNAGRCDGIRRYLEQQLHRETTTKESV